MSYGLLLKMKELIMLFFITLRSTKFLLSSNLYSKLNKNPFAANIKFRTHVIFVGSKFKKILRFSVSFVNLLFCYV